MEKGLPIPRHICISQKLSEKPESWQPCGILAGTTGYTAGDIRECSVQLRSTIWLLPHFSVQLLAWFPFFQVALVLAFNQFLVREWFVFAECMPGPGNAQGLEPLDQGQWGKANYVVLSLWILTPWANNNIWYCEEMQLKNPHWARQVHVVSSLEITGCGALWRSCVHMHSSLYVPSLYVSWWDDIQCYSAYQVDRTINWHTKCLSAYQVDRIWKWHHRFGQFGSRTQHIVMPYWWMGQSTCDGARVISNVRAMPTQQN